MEGQSERRQYPRRDKFMECALRHESAVTHSRITKVSLAGCYVESPHVPVPGEAITLTVAANSAGLSSLTGTAVNVHRGVGFGVQFTALDPATRAHLEKFIEATDG